MKICISESLRNSFIKVLSAAWEDTAGLIKELKGLEKELSERVNQIKSLYRTKKPVSEPNPKEKEELTSDLSKTLKDLTETSKSFFNLVGGWQWEKRPKPERVRD